MTDGVVLDGGTEQCLKMTNDEWDCLDYKCPFCGGDTQEFTKRVWKKSDVFPDGFDAITVHCDGCCAEGPIASSKEQAIEYYNGNFNQKQNT